MTPSAINYGDVESFITIRGSGINGSTSTTVVFSGPAGEIGISPNNAAEDGTFPVDLGYLQVFVPVEVALTPGMYTIDVYAVYGEITNHSGPVSFEVRTVTIPVPPLVFAPESVIVEADSSRGGTGTFDVTAVSADGGTTYPVTCNPESGSFFTFGPHNVTCSATNEFGTTTVSFTLVVTDTTPPVVTVPGNISSETPVVSWEAATAVDTVDGTRPVSCSPASGSTFPSGVTLVTCTAFDDSLNPGHGYFTVTVTRGLPILHLPDTVYKSTTGTTANVTFTVTATDGTVTCTPPSGSDFPLGLSTVSCTATNEFGSVSGNFFVYVFEATGDTTPPVINAPDVTAEATGPGGAMVPYIVSATDDVDGNVGVVCTPISGSVFPLGPTTVNCTATDQAGNVANDSFIVTVVDTTPPVLNVANVTEEATSAAGAVVTFSPTATDLVDGSVAVVCTPASGSTFSLGPTTVNCSATDAANNTGTASFTVTVVDTTPPVVSSVTANPSTLWPPNHQMVNVTVHVQATDLTDANPTSQIIAVQSNQPINGTGDGDTAPDWNITGPLTLQLRSERSSGIDRIYTITVRTMDLFGNFTTSSVQVKVTQSKSRAVR